MMKLTSSRGAVSRVLLAALAVVALAAGGGVYLLSRGGDGGVPEEPPPISEARLEGRFEPAAFFGAELAFAPGCPTGPCDVTAEGKRPKMLLASKGPAVPSVTRPGQKVKTKTVQYVAKKATIPTEIDLTRNGGTYTGVDEFGITCVYPGFKVPTTATYEITVTDAETIGGVWRATELRVSTAIRTERRTYHGEFFNSTCNPQEFGKEGTASLLS